jgi:hypothetical protein
MVCPLRFGSKDGLMLGAVTLSLCGCLIHPLPGDLPRVSTAAIVERIRCEAQEGLRSVQQHDQAVKRIVEGTTIAYEFSFTITEDNAAASGKLTFERPNFTGGTLTLDFRPSAALKRANTRTFTVLEDLGKLNAVNCAPEAVTANWVYPITGSIGMAEVVETYIKLQLLAGLGKAKFPADVFSDELEFTTTLRAGVKPTLELNAVAGTLRLTDASKTGTAQRMDKHDLTVAFAYDGPPTAQRLARAQASQAWWTANAGALDSRALRRVVQSETEAPNRALLELARRRNAREDAVRVGKLLGTSVP